MGHGHHGYHGPSCPWSEGTARHSEGQRSLKVLFLLTDAARVHATPGHVEGQGSDSKLPKDEGPHCRAAVPLPWLHCQTEVPAPTVQHHQIAVSVQNDHGHQESEAEQ